MNLKGNYKQAKATSVGDINSPICLFTAELHYALDQKAKGGNSVTSNLALLGLQEVRRNRKISSKSTFMPFHFQSHKRADSALVKEIDRNKRDRNLIQTALLHT